MSTQLPAVTVPTVYSSVVPATGVKVYDWLPLPAHPD